MVKSEKGGAKKVLSLFSKKEIKVKRKSDKYRMMGGKVATAALVSNKSNWNHDDLNIHPGNQTTSNCTPSSNFPFFPYPTPFFLIYIRQTDCPKTIAPKDLPETFCLGWYICRTECHTINMLNSVRLHLFMVNTSHSISLK